MKNYRYVRFLNKILLLLTLAMFNTSFVWANHYSILDERDFSLLKSPEPAISWPDGTRSFWEWHCYDARSVSVQCTDICSSDSETEDGDCNWETSSDKLVSLFFENGQVREDYDFEDKSDNCEEQIAEVKKLMDGQESICFLASYLQDIQSPNWRLWSLFQIKTAKGTWGANTDELLTWVPEAEE